MNCDNKRAAKNAYLKSYYIKNKERLAQSKKKYMARPEVKARYTEYMRIYMRAYREKKQDVNAAIQDRYNKTPKGRANQARGRHKRRAASKQVVNDLSYEEWEEILENQNHKCAHCHTQFTVNFQPTIDHIIPVSRGGGLTADNVQALCRRCNSKKGDRLESELIYIGGL